MFHFSISISKILLRQFRPRHTFTLRPTVHTSKLFTYTILTDTCCLELHLACGCLRLRCECLFVKPQCHFLPEVSVVIRRVNKVIQFTIFEKPSFLNHVLLQLQKQLTNSSSAVIRTDKSSQQQSTPLSF